MEWSLNSPKLPSALSYVATHKTAFDVISHKFLCDLGVVHHLLSLHHFVNDKPWIRYRRLQNYLAMGLFMQQ